MTARPDPRPADVSWSGEPSVQSRRLLGVLRLFLRPTVNLSLAGAEFLMTHGPSAIGRSVGPRVVGLVDGCGRLFPPPEGTVIEPVELDTCPAEWIRASRVAPGGDVVLYFHGGGYVGGGLASHRRLVAGISASSGAAVLNVAYRMLPTWPISAAVDDGVTAYRRLLADGVEPSRVVLAGDSAGGGLVFLVARAIREQDLPRPGGIVALSPWANFDTTARAVHANASSDPFALGRVTGFVARRLMSKHGPLDPKLSSVNCDLAGLPPVLIHVGTTEVLEADAVELAEALSAAGVPVQLKHWRGQVHVFQVFARWLPESREALGEIGAFIKQVTATGAAEDPGEIRVAL